MDRDIRLSSVGYVAVDHKGAVYIADSDRGQIVKVSAAGEVLARWGGPGDGSGYFDGVTGLAVDARGLLYASDEPNGSVHKLSANGQGLACWGWNGDGAEQFSHPQGLTLDTSGNIVIADTYNCRIQTLSLTGRHLQSWAPVAGAPSANSTIQPTWSLISRARYSLPTHGMLVSNAYSTGQVLGIYRHASAADMFVSPAGVALDGAGSLYVADSAPQPRIVKLSPWGTPLATWLLGPATLDCVQGVAIAPDGNAYITAYTARHDPIVLKLSVAGEVIATWQ